MRLLITGARGLLGTELVDRASRLGLEVHATDIDEMDVTDRGAVESVVGSLRPEVILHCAAYTAVDRAEEEPDAAMRVNRDGTRNVARAAAEVGSLLIYLSTDYVFDGEKRSPYVPEDPPNPQGAYARSKLAGEEEAQSAGGEWLVVRSGWLYGSGGKDFVDAIVTAAREGRKLRVVSDQRGCPTWVGSLTPALLDLIEGGARGIFHVTDRGEATWHELAEMALALAGIDAEVAPVSTEEWGAPAPRPEYSVLDLEKAESFLGNLMPRWQDSLRHHLEEGLSP